MAIKIALMDSIHLKNTENQRAQIDLSQATLSTAKAQKKYAAFNSMIYRLVNIPLSKKECFENE